MRTIVLSLIVCGLAGCAPNAVREADVAAKDGAVSASLIATIDGKYVLYRVATGERVLYFVDRVGRAAGIETSWLENCGKGCTRSVDVQTLGN